MDSKHPPAGNPINVDTHKPALDGLRAFAVLMVMWFHAYHLKSDYFQGGGIGVDIFFVLSGFLITSKLLSEYNLNGTISLKLFYARRLLRLYPALLLLILGYLIFTLIFQPKLLNPRSIDSLCAVFYTGNWLRAFQIRNLSWLGHTWSLALEEQFYLLWPLIMIIALRSKSGVQTLLRTAIVIGVFSFLSKILLLYMGTNSARFSEGLDTRADTIMFGCLLAILSRSEYAPRLSKPYRAVKHLTPLALFIFLMIHFFNDPNNLHRSLIIIPFVGVFTSLVIFSLLLEEKTLTSKLLATPVFVWIGQISYGLYLWHYPIMRYIRDLKFDSIYILIYGSLFSFLAAVISYYLLEQPVLKLKKKFQAHS